MAAYQLAGLGWLLGAHTRAIEILAKHQRPASQMARHVEYAASIDDKSASLLLSAVHDYVWQDPAQTARLLRAMADLKPAGAMSDCDRGALLGKALALSGQLVQAIEVLDRVAGQISNGSPLRTEVVRWRACSLFCTGRLGEATEVLSAGIAAVRSADTKSAATLRRTRLAFALTTGTPADQSDLAYLTRYTATAAGLEASHTAGILAMAACRDSGETADRYAEVAAQGFDNSTDDEVAQHLAGLYWFVQAEGFMGRLEAAIHRCERGLRIAEQRQMALLSPLFVAVLSGLQLRYGDINGAVRHAACARVAGTAIGCPYVLELADALEASIYDAEREVLAGRAETTGAPAEENEPARSAAVPDREAERSKARIDKLSGREAEIALLISHGKTNQQIARLLGLSHKTVETYIARIFAKLAASCRAEVAALVGRCGAF
jgi:DNA-binding CsgD family transcriptional regulator